MRKVAYLHCLGCLDVTLFVLHHPTEAGAWDENLSQCSACGYAYGYIDHEGTTRVDETGRVVTTYAPRPVLEAEVLRAGMLKYQQELAAALVQRYGPNYREKHGAWAAHHAGSRSGDPGERSRLLRAQPLGRPRKV